MRMSRFLIPILMSGLLLILGCSRWDTDVFAREQSIEMQITGGFAGISRKVEISPTDEGIEISDRSDFPQQQANRRLLTSEEHDALWQTLLDNDVFELPTNLELTRFVADAFSYEITVWQGPAKHAFAVYAPEMLASDREEPRYEQIVHAILELATF